MDDAEADLDCVQNGALYRELPLATLTISGPDRLTWLNGLVTCELAKVGPGDAVYGLLVAKSGKIQSEIYLCVGPEDVALGVQRGQQSSIAETLDRYLVMEDAEISQAPLGAWILSLGPLSSKALEAARAAGGRGGLVTRGGLTGAVVTGENANALLGPMTAVTPSRLASDAGWNRARIENGIPEHGVDFDETNYPQEASIEKDAVSFTKGCYLGQEAVFMLEKRGHVKKRLVQLLVQGDVEIGDPISTADGVQVGTVTSRLRRPWKNLALGYVKYKHAAAETELRIREAPATVTALLAITPES